MGVDAEWVHLGVSLLVCDSYLAIGLLLVKGGPFIPCLHHLIVVFVSKLNDSFIVHVQVVYLDGLIHSKGGLGGVGGEVELLPRHGVAGLLGEGGEHPGGLLIQICARPQFVWFEVSPNAPSHWLYHSDCLQMLLLFLRQRLFTEDGVLHLEKEEVSLLFDFDFVVFSFGEALPHGLSPVLFVFMVDFLVFRRFSNILAKLHLTPSRVLLLWVVELITNDRVVDAAHDADIAQLIHSLLPRILEDLRLLLEPTQVPRHSVVGLLHEGVQLWRGLLGQKGLSHLSEAGFHRVQLLFHSVVVE